MQHPIKELFTNPSKKGALRAGLTALPMILAIPFGSLNILVPLGQAGFFYSIQPIPEKRLDRMIVGLLMLGVGLSFYLLGATVTQSLPLIVFYTFLLGIVLSLFSSWKLLGIGVFSYMSIYCAGLNTGDPQKAATQFVAFSFALLWGCIISLLPYWEGADTLQKTDDNTQKYLLNGFRMGIGASIAAFFSEMFAFTKLGWAPSAVGNVIRFDDEISKKRAYVRAVASIIGAFLGLAITLLLNQVIWLILVSYVLIVINGLTLKNNKLGYLPLYTTVILILYSINSPADSTALAIQRVLYNVFGVLIALLVLWYPFPRVVKYIKQNTQ